MKIFIPLFVFGVWLIAIGIGAKLGTAIVWGGALVLAAPAAATVYYAWLILFRPPA
ncbi:hypothetical protein [Parathalassolituus penaei]|uniref:Uncharacterized protein n=1 Tax=Parathalassolituus penaei TaxID=2997323 RepID=A0A9X3ITQ2_9GAMM|nr:hypothetical protein [Parathalassolituus penaei]MCY0966129.1 hypothetical protein [Parathalassolituus penaei]